MAIFTIFTRFYVIPIELRGSVVLKVVDAGEHSLYIILFNFIQSIKKFRFSVFITIKKERFLSQHLKVIDCRHNVAFFLIILFTIENFATAWLRNNG